MNRKLGEYHRTGTKEEVAVILFEEHLTQEDYSYEAVGVTELYIQTTYGLSTASEYCIQYRTHTSSFPF